MRIQSKFKDYYDFIGQRYGEDPDLVYARGKVALPTGTNLIKNREIGDRRFSRCLVGAQREDLTTKTTWRLIYVVAGEFVIPCVRGFARAVSEEHDDVIDRPPTILHEVLTKDMYEWLVVTEASSKRLARIRKRYGYDYHEEDWQKLQASLQSPAMKQDMREVMTLANAPVFVIYSHLGVFVDEYVPRLADYGIPSVIEPQAMWQNVYSTLTNVLRPNPDKDPPVTIADKDKIVKAGFDLKTSFRNPVNPKPRR
jgi:hypothetical protein